MRGDNLDVGRFVVTALVLAALIGSGIASAEPWKTSRRHDASAVESCPTSRTSARPVSGRPSFNFGNARIAVSLPKGAKFVAVPDGTPGGAWIQKDGWIRTKVGWFSSHGRPGVNGRRVDGSSGRLRADVGPLSYSSAGKFYPSLLYFPSFGCWRITANAVGARLTALVVVTR